MRRYYSIPLLFFFLATILGLFLRWQFINPTPGVRYNFFLHAHSHIMFLGWVFNVLYLFFINEHTLQKDRRLFVLLFAALQTLVIAMMISFPLQGYGLYSIVFSTLHTLVSIIFIWHFFRKTKNNQQTSVWLARIALGFFAFSTMGPFFLGYLMANGMGDSPWYNFAIYFYLHFQYNGFFMFGILSLFFRLLENRKVSFNVQRCRSALTLMAIACLPAYVLSILYADTGYLFNITGTIAALMQILAAALLAKQIAETRIELKLHLRHSVYRIIELVVILFCLKIFLQLISAHPDVARLAYDLRPVVIAYLHLVLVGVVTLFLFAWYIQMDLVEELLAVRSVIVLLLGFSGSQICLVLIPWWNHLFGESALSPVHLIFAFSILLVLGGFLFLLAFLNSKHDKNQLMI